MNCPPLDQSAALSQAALGADTFSVAFGRSREQQPQAFQPRTSFKPPCLDVVRLAVRSVAVPPVVARVDGRAAKAGSKKTIQK